MIKFSLIVNFIVQQPSKTASVSHLNHVKYICTDLPKGTKFLNKRIIAGVTGFCPNSLQKTAIAPTLKFGLVPVVKAFAHDPPSAVLCPTRAPLNAIQDRLSMSLAGPHVAAARRSFASNPHRTGPRRHGGCA